MPTRPACELSLTMRPSPRETIVRATAWVTKNRPLRLTSIIASQSDSVTSRASWLAPRPALLTRMSMRPRSATRCCTAGSIPARSVTSSSTATARPPAARTCSTRSATSAAERAPAATVVPPDTIDDVVLSHCHLDHCGYLPALVRDGFRGPVWLTEGTGALTAIVLRDSGFLNERDAELAREGGWSKHTPPLPLYTADDADRAITHFRTVAFDTTTELADGFRFRMSRAGHVLGSASSVVVSKATVRKWAIARSASAAVYSGRGGVCLDQPPSRASSASRSLRNPLSRSTIAVSAPVPSVSHTGPRKPSRTRAGR